MFNQRGSLLIEALLSMIIVGVIASIMLQVNQLVLRNSKQDSNIDIYISIMQLQELLAKSEIINITSEQLEILYFNKEYELFEHNERLVKREGYQILIENISEVMFSYEEETIYIQFYRNEKNYQFAIGKKEWWRH